MNTDMPEIEVIIEYDGFIAGRELSEIIEVLDDALWYEIEDLVFLGAANCLRYLFAFHSSPSPRRRGPG